MSEQTYQETLGNMFAKFLQIQRQNTKDEKQERQDMLHGAGEPHSSSDGLEMVYYADDKVSSVRNEVPCTCTSKGVQVFRPTKKNNKRVYIGNCLGHSINGSSTHLAIEEDTGNHLIIKKWTIPLVLDQIRKKGLINLNKDRRTMSRLTHPSMVPYRASIMHKETSELTSKRIVYIFRSFVLGSPLKHITNQLNLIGDQDESLRLLRNVGIGVLSALKVLHSEGIVHGDVRCENVYLDNYGEVKLVGASLDARLCDIVDCGSYCDRLTVSQDIKSTGELLISIVAPKQKYLEIPPDLPSSAKDFLARCLTEDNHSEQTAEQLVNHVFLTNVPAKVENKKQQDDDASSSEDNIVDKMLNNSFHKGWRIHTEFEMLECLGEGAYGRVYKVKKQLDSRFYAIKLIKLNPENVKLNMKIIREVELLSLLNHENVVRYYNSWIEPYQATEDDGLLSFDEGYEMNSEIDSEDSYDFDDEQEPSPCNTIRFNSSTDEESKGIYEKLNGVLQIQMEFCERRTLRQAIDLGLCQFRAWRLFRQVVEGLAHVHQRGIIHRDLKPVNIFLDSHDHVKIGDFGLATMTFTGLPVEDKTAQEDKCGSFTGGVGTALYIAPEQQSAKKAIYNQKVDIYSLGIILFEMFYPFNTAMERNQALVLLRSSDISLPDDFLTPNNKKQIHVIRWLLNHEASLRPTCTELLASEHVPRQVKEGTLSGLLSHTLSNRGARGYQGLIAACMDQQQTADDYTYQNNMDLKSIDVLSNLKNAVIKIFSSHGAKEFAPPLLIPRAKAWEEYPDAVKVMTASGTVCHLPHDLRVPFAMYTAYSDIKYFRRYCVSHVYREHRPGSHPRETLECAFDIVTPKIDASDLWSDAELIVAASRAASECSLKVKLKLNHTELLRTLLLACGIALDKHAEIYQILVDVSLGLKCNRQLKIHLNSLSITKESKLNLLRLIEADVPVMELEYLVMPLITQDRWLDGVANSIRELNAVCENTKALGCECPITVAPLLASNPDQHSGVFWHMTVVKDNDRMPKNKRRPVDIVAAGGRYDALVEEFWKVARTKKGQDNIELKTCSVGFTMSLHRMAINLKKMKIDLPLSYTLSMKSTVTYACMGSDHGHFVALARALWAVNLPAAVIPVPNVDTRDLPRPHIVVMPGDSNMKVIYYEAKRVRRRKVAYTDILEFIKQQYNPTPNTDRYQEVCGSHSFQSKPASYVPQLRRIHNSRLSQRRSLRRESIRTQFKIVDSTKVQSFDNELYKCKTSAEKCHNN